jgi:hypothetical protein
MLTRRKFVQSITAGVAATLMINPINSLEIKGRRKLGKLGYIEGIIGKELDADWKSALKETVGYGYSEIEIGRYRGESAKSFLSYCNETGIKPVAGGTVFSKNIDSFNFI